MGVRRALGASGFRITSLVLGERFKVALWGVAGMLFWGTMLVAFLRKAAGMDPLGPLPYLVIGASLVAVAVVASMAAVREALDVEPNAVID